MNPTVKIDLPGVKGSDVGPVGKSDKNIKHHVKFRLFFER